MINPKHAELLDALTEALHDKNVVIATLSDEIDRLHRKIESIENLAAKYGYGAVKEKTHE